MDTESKVIVVLLDGTVEFGDINLYNTIYENYKNDLDFFFLDEKVSSGVKGACGFRFVDEQDIGKDNPYRKALNLKLGGNYILFKSEEDRPSLLTSEEASNLKFRLELESKFKIKDSNYLLTTVGREGEGFQLLPAEEPFTLEKYVEYYLEEPQQLELMKLSKLVGTQVTMWVSRKDHPYKNSEDYNVWASKVLSNELEENIKVFYEAIITKRTMDRGIIEKFLPLEENEVKDVIVDINQYEEYRLSNYKELRELLEG